MLKFTFIFCGSLFILAILMSWFPVLGETMNFVGMTTSKAFIVFVILMILGYRVS